MLDDVVFDEAFTNACDRPAGDEDAVRPAGRVSSGPTDRFANLERLSLALDDDEAGCQDRKMEVTFIDMEKGESVLFEYETEDGSETLLVDAGSKSDRTSHLKSVLAEKIDGEDNVIDHLVVSHNHSDHMNHVDELLQSDDFEVESVHFSGVKNRNPDGSKKKYVKRVESAISESDETNVDILEEGEFIRFGDARANVLSVAETPKDGDDEHDVDAGGVVMTVTHNQTTYLMTADLRKEALLEVTREYDLHYVDVLKANHHATSSNDEMVVSPALLESTTPKSIVISNKNIGTRSGSFSPDCGVFDRAEKRDIPIYWTARHDDFTFTSVRSGILISPRLNGDATTSPEALQEKLPFECGDGAEGIMHSTAASPGQPTWHASSLTVQDHPMARPTTGGFVES